MSGNFWEGDDSGGEHTFLPFSPFSLSGLECGCDGWQSSNNLVTMKGQGV